MAGRRGQIAGLMLSVLLVAGCGGGETVLPTAPTPTPGMRFIMPTPGTPPPTPARTPTAVMMTYIVQEGDTLYDIALRYGVDMDEIIAINGLEDPNTLYVGQELLIPLPPPTAAPATPTPTFSP